MAFADRAARVFVSWNMRDMGIAEWGSVSPDGDISKAFSFNAALGIFIVSTAIILPVSGMRPRSKSFYRWCYIPLVLFSYFAETVQNFRGVDPRFVQNGSTFDYVISTIFPAVAMLLVVFYLTLGAQYFRKRVMEAHPELGLGIRYAMIAVLVSLQPVYGSPSMRDVLPGSAAISSGCTD